MLLAATLWWTPRERHEAARWVERTHAVLLTTQRLLSAMQDAETGQRGYLLTAERAYLEPFRQGTLDAPARLDELRQLTADSSSQQQILTEVASLIAAKSAELADTVARVRAGDMAGAVALVRTGAGKGFMDAIREKIAAVSAAEVQRLGQRQARTAAAEQRSQIVLGTLGVMTLGLMIGLTAGSIRAAAQAATNESTSQFHALADGMPALCWMANPDGWIFWYNQGWYQYTGTTPRQMEGWGWQSVHDPNVLPLAMERWTGSIATGNPFEMTFPLKGADGRFRPFLTRVTPLRAADGSIVRWFGTNTDISDERHHAETLERMVEDRTAALLHEIEERRLAQEALRQSEKLQVVGQLTGGIAHDFNNMLQVISAGVRLLKSPRLTEARKTMLLDGMEKSTDDAAGLVRRLLSVARKQQIDPRPLNLNERLSESADLLRRTLGSNVRVKTNVAPGLWPVLADQTEFEMALLNLAVNARDAMPSGGTIIIRAHNEMSEAAGERIRITVEDTGTGMAPAVMARAFEPFFTTKAVGKGTGLGLSQVYGFARQAGGSAAVESEPGLGTTVTLHLPRAREGIAPPGAATSASASVGEAMMRAYGKVVLVVDDNPEIAAFATAMLEGLGYTVRQAANAPDALALLDSGEKVDAVFSDVVMPGHIDGAEVAVVMASGYTDQREQLNALPVEVLAKPYFLDSLAAALDRTLRAATARDPVVSVS